MFVSHLFVFFSCCLCGSCFVFFFRHLFFSFLKPDFMKCCSALLCLAAIAGCLVTTNADSVTIYDAYQLMQYFQGSSSNVVKDFELADDLDFSSAPFQLTLPLGAKDTGGCAAYFGAFHGNGHSIKGLVMNTWGT